MLRSAKHTMRWVCCLLFALKLSMYLLAVSADIKQASHLAFEVEGTYIVELTATASLAEFLSYLYSSRIQYHIIQRFSTLNAVAIQFPFTYLNQISNYEEVLNIWPEVIHSKYITTKPNIFSEFVDWSTFPNVDDSNSNNRTSDALIASHLNGYAADPNSAHKLTGVQLIHQTTNLTGAGIKVGVIDSGIDYTHSALGGCFGAGCRIAYGHDFVGDDGKSPSSNPLDQCFGHGTHCAGIIGGKDPESPWVGVAPGVIFGIYRVLACSGLTSDTILMAAMDRAVQDGMDILSISIDSLGWAESASAELASRIAAKIPVVVSIGNDGTQGIWTSGAPAVGYDAIGVASVNNLVASEWYFTVDAESSKQFSYLRAPNASSPLSPNATRIIDVSGQCPPTDLDKARGKFFLVDVLSTSNCPKSSTVFSLTSVSGAAGVIYYNFFIPEEDLAPVAERQPDFPLISLRNNDGKYLAQLLKSKPDLDITWGLDQQVFPMVNPDMITRGSSWGISPDLDMKPDIAAPGGKIISTWIVKYGGWSQEQGTSMAAPYIAGSIALLMEKFGKLPPLAIRSILLSTAIPIKQSDGLLYPVARQGSGVVNVANALAVQTFVNPTKLALNNQSDFSLGQDQNLTITNTLDVVVKYQLMHLPAASFTGYNGSDPYPLLQVITKESPATITFSQEFVSVGPKEQLTVHFHINPPANLDPSEHWFYSGFIQIRPNTTEVPLTIPYTGVLTTGLVDVLDQVHGFPHLVFGSSSANVGFTAANSSLGIVINLENPSRLVTIGLITGDNATDVGFFANGGYQPYTSRTLEPTTVNFNGKIGVGDPNERGEFGSSKDVADGEYRVVVKAVKLFGNLKLSGDWEVWISQVFTVKRGVQ